MRIFPPIAAYNINSSNKLAYFLESMALDTAHSLSPNTFGSRIQVCNKIKGWVQIAAFIYNHLKF